MKPKWLPANIGAEPKKIAVLGGLVVLLAVVWWANRTPSSPATTTRPAIPVGQPVSPGPIPSPEIRPAQRRAANGTGRTIDDFRPTVKLPEGTDVSRIDPSLHIDLMAKAQGGDAASGVRNLFEFAQPPAPPPPKVDPIKPKPLAVEVPKPVSVSSAEPPKPPPPPPIPLKYYGFAGTPQNGQRQACFLDGEDIFVAKENDLVRNRYRVVRIGVNSAVVEDTTNKNQQTLPLVEEL